MPPKPKKSKKPEPPRGVGETQEERGENPPHLKQPSARSAEFEYIDRLRDRSKWNGEHAVLVEALRRIVGRFQCRLGVSLLVCEVPPPVPPQDEEKKEDFEVNVLHRGVAFSTCDLQMPLQAAQTDSMLLIQQSTGHLADPHFDAMQFLQRNEHKGHKG